ALALAACSSPEDVADQAGVDDSGQQAVSSPVPQPPQPPAPSGMAVSVSEENDLYAFDFAYPTQVAAIPELKARMDQELDTSKSELIKLAREGRSDAKENGFPYNAYASGTVWEVVADTPRFLSLSASNYSYTGGTHPNTNATALVWDRESGKALEALAVFTSAEAFNQAISEPYCAQLNKERTKRREGYDENDSSSECPPPSDLTILLTSSSGTAINRIGLVASPYVAGPYAEGTYDISVPVTAKVLSAVKPAYRAAFASK
ncbi:DUF4163 domain-containing protein, partial [Altererythrobacter sp.]|nr:DUF4163 domain-containing protein [Altererythrobacter sp.]